MSGIKKFLEGYEAARVGGLDQAVEGLAGLLKSDGQSVDLNSDFDVNIPLHREFAPVILTWIAEGLLRGVCQASLEGALAARDKPMSEVYQLSKEVVYGSAALQGAVATLIALENGELDQPTQSEDDEFFDLLSKVFPGATIECFKDGRAYGSLNLNPEPGASQAPEQEPVEDIEPLDEEDAGWPDSYDHGDDADL